MLTQTFLERRVLKHLDSAYVERDDIQKYIDCALSSTKPLSLDEFFFLTKGNIARDDEAFNFTITICVYPNTSNLREKDALGIAFVTSFKDMASFKEFMTSNVHLEIGQDVQVGFVMPEGIKMTGTTLKKSCVIPRGYIADLRVNEGKSKGFCRGTQEHAQFLKDFSFEKILAFAS